MNTLTKGQRVVISNPDAGTCSGLVLDILTPATLAEIPGFDTANVREILESLGITQMALIQHLHNGEPACFAALGDGKGNWLDLRRKPLSITTHGVEN